MRRHIRSDMNLHGVPTTKANQLMLFTQTILLIIRIIQTPVWAPDLFRVEADRTRSNHSRCFKWCSSSKHSNLLSAL